MFKYQKDMFRTLVSEKLSKKLIMFLRLLYAKFNFRNKWNFTQIPFNIKTEKFKFVNLGFCFYV
jgi:hypothetical protein